MRAGVDTLWRRSYTEEAGGSHTPAEAPFANVFLRIIDEFADGFLILNEERRVVFFNDVFLRSTGLRSQDVFAREQELLGALGGLEGDLLEHEVELPSRDRTSRRFAVSSLSVQGERGTYVLVRVKPATPAPAGRADLWERLVTNLGDPVLTVDLSGVVTCANPSFYRLVGYAPDEPLPNINGIYIHPAELDDKLMRLSRSGSVENLETHLATRDRQLRRVLDTSWVLRNESGAITGYTCHLKDVTYVKNLEAKLKISERNYLVLFESIPSSIVIVDPEGRILNCNYTAEKMYGYRWQELAGRHFDEVFQVQKKSPPIAEALKRAAANQGRHVETDVPRRCRDGAIRFTYASYTALVASDGETIGWSIGERDLTDRVRLEKKLQASYDQLRDTQEASILGFAKLTEYRENETGDHLARMPQYTRALALGLKRLEKYREYIDDGYIEDLCLSCILHDVGKVAIEDAILLKPGKLTPDEFERIKEHSRLGGEALREMDKKLGFENYLTIGKQIAYYHHERWDGSGYPEGLRGDKIPLSARIVALADVYDALTSKRPYKEPLPHQEAARIIAAERGTHFDPDVVDVFLAEQETFEHIRTFHDFQAHPETIDDLIAPADGKRGRSTEA